MSPTVTVPCWYPCGSQPPVLPSPGHVVDPESVSVPGTHSPLGETSTFYFEGTLPQVSPGFLSPLPSGQGVYFYFYISWNLSFEIINHFLAAIFLHPGNAENA